MNFLKIFLFLGTSLFLAACGIHPDQIDSGKITSINIIDRNGMSETINSKDRLSTFENTDFLGPQPYQKVLRVYGREKNGDIHSCITSYHPNGQIKQYLEASNNRALGKYREWYPNGNKKVEATIVGGMADINSQAEQSWLFDGINLAWDVQGTLIAEIPYNKGDLQGEALYYHTNGQLWKKCPYDHNKLHGTTQIFLDNGHLFQTITYQEGIKEGDAYRYWNENQIAYQETYEKGLLMEGRYYDSSGKSLSTIAEGRGFRAIFGKKELQQLEEYQKGIQEGQVKLFDTNLNIISLYSTKNGEKHGDEIIYFPSSTKPKLLLTWHEGVLQGPMKTWYENGQLESQREMSSNQKHGLLSAWYPNGALMIVEEYDSDKLKKGEYYRVGERGPISQIVRGNGVATLFSPEGNFSKKVHYQDGKPVE